MQYTRAMSRRATQVLARHTHPGPLVSAAHAAHCHPRKVLSVEKQLVRSAVHKLEGLAVGASLPPPAAPSPGFCRGSRARPRESGKGPLIADGAVGSAFLGCCCHLAAGTQNFMLMASEADNGNLNGTQSDLLATWLGFCIRRLLFYIWMSCDDDGKGSRQPADRQAGHSQCQN